MMHRGNPLDRLFPGNMREWLMRKDDDNKELADSVRALACAIESAAKELRDHFKLATKCDLKEMECRIMSKISEFGLVVNTRFDELGTAVDGVAADVAFLKTEIERLQNTPGPITPEDQAILDSIQSRADQLSEKVKALDAATEQVPTPPPGV